MVRASHWVGLIFPGMIDEPGSFSGILNSAKPARGPQAYQRTSLAIFISAPASVRSAALTSTMASWADSAANLFAADAGLRRDRARRHLAEARVGVQAGADGGTANGEGAGAAVPGRVLPAPGRAAPPSPRSLARASTASHPAGESGPPSPAGKTLSPWRPASPARCGARA